MILMGVNQFGITIYKIEDGLFYCTAIIEAGVEIEGTIKTSAPEKVTIQRLLKEIGKTQKK